MQKQFCGSDAVFQCVSELSKMDVFGLEGKKKGGGKLRLTYSGTKAVASSTLLKVI